MQLPSLLIQSLQQTKGFDESAFTAVHQSGKQVISVRLNPFKQLNAASSKKDNGAADNYPPLVSNNLAGKVPWCSNGIYLSQRPSFTADPLFHAGAYYVQEASSMFLETALLQSADLGKPVRVLDLCAAPGGKSTLLQSLLGADSLLVSNEVIKTRVNILAENITKWGAANVIVTNNDPRDFQRLENYFDVMVVDAPCSGSGLFRKDPAAINEWSEQNVALCSQRQQRILADALPALKEDGLLIYSTCSYSEQEDEAIADWLAEEMKMETVQLKLPQEWGIVETQSNRSNAFGYRFYPNRVKGEGFFIALFKKTTGTGEWNIGKQKNKLDKPGAKELSVLQPFLHHPDDLFFIRQKETILAMPHFFEADLLAVQQALYIKKAGVSLGTVIRDELIPDHELALSRVIDPLLPAIEVDVETALQYLRRQDISLASDARGWALLTQQGLPLGWVKILPNRINNYYPKEWRILNK